MQVDLQAGAWSTPTSLLMEPRHTADYWQAKLNAQAVKDPANCILGIRWWQSNGGRPWVRPQVLVQDLRNRTVLAKAQGRPGLEPEKSSAC